MRGFHGQSGPKLLPPSPTIGTQTHSSSSRPIFLFFIAGPIDQTIDNGRAQTGSKSFFVSAHLPASSTSGKETADEHRSRPTAHGDST